MLYTGLEGSAILFGAPEGDDASVGVGKTMLAMLRALRDGTKSTSVPSLPSIDRPYQEWEMDVALGFDKAFDVQCSEWQLARDLAIFYQMTLSSVPSLVSALDGGALAPDQTDQILSANAMANIGFSINLFNPPHKLTVQIHHPCVLLQRHPNKIYLQASLTHPKLLCPALPYLRFGGSMENEILSTPSLPDFDFFLNQQQAESLLCILNCPGAVTRKFFLKYVNIFEVFWSFASCCLKGETFKTLKTSQHLVRLLHQKSTWSCEVFVYRCFCNSLFPIISPYCIIDAFNESSFLVFLNLAPLAQHWKETWMKRRIWKVGKCPLWRRVSRTALRNLGGYMKSCCEVLILCSLHYTSSLRQSKIWGMENSMDRWYSLFSSLYM